MRSASAHSSTIWPWAVRVDLEGVPEADLRLRDTGREREGAVHERGGDDRMPGLVRRRRGQVVVLAGVDDDPGATVDHAAHVLVAERPLRVDVAKEDPVHRVVQHQIEPLERPARRDLGHAQARGVVGEAHVPADLPHHLVERGPYAAEVGLGRERPAEALGGLAVGDVVEQALRGRADDGDHVGAGPRRGLGLARVLMDVARGDDHVEPRGLGIAVLLDQPVAPCPLGSDPLVGLLRKPRGQLPRRCNIGVRPQCCIAGGHSLGDLLRRGLAVDAGPRQREGEAAGEARPERVDEHVRERDAEVVDPVDSEQTRDRALDRDGGVAERELHDRSGDGVGERERLVGEPTVEIQLHPANPATTS